MKKAVLIILGIVVFVAAALSVYISMIDWNKHKDKIAAQFSEVTGKRVVFEGPVSFTLLPSPYLTASNIKVYNETGENAHVPLASIKSLVAKLSLQPLLRGNFEVKMMSLVEPEILLEVQSDGKLNWQSPLSEEQKFSLENVEVTLDSVMLEKATLNVVDPRRNVDVMLENLNAEVIAPSIFGPYRIEGSYIKDNNPEGFAISLGQFSESFATTVNFVLNHPTSQTFVRFDGSVLLNNDALSGNLVIDSQKPVDFINKNFKSASLGAEYDYPLALSLQVETNKTKIDLSNVVVKYGTSAGAGNVLIPRPEEPEEGEEPERRQIEAAFEMTDLDLVPAVKTIQHLLNKYKAEGAAYEPRAEFDLIADVKSINSTYNNQNIRDFNLSVDFVDNDLTIRSLSATLSGDTGFEASGDIFSRNGELTYNLDVEYTTADLQKLAGWLGYGLTQVTPSTYKRSVGSATVAGTLKTVKIAPFELTVDKSSLKGEAGIITGSRNNYYLDVTGDNINFDNYIGALPEETAVQGLAARMAYRFGKLAFVNDADWVIKANLALGIYENIPFENTRFDGKITNGIMEINGLSVGSVANARLEASGVVKGFGSVPQFEGVKYNLSTQDISLMLNKFDINRPGINLKNIKTLSSQGTVSGTFDKVSLNAVSKIEYLETMYSGQLAGQDGKLQFSGILELKSPDFVKLVNDLNFDYNPKAFSLGVFNMAAQLAGTPDKFTASRFNSFVGSNNIRGAFAYDNTGERPGIVANLKINKFEFDRFFYNSKEDNKVIFRGGSVPENEEFIAKPFLDKTKINYAFYKTFNLKGKFDIDDLTYKGAAVKNAKFNLTLQDGKLDIKDFNGLYNGGSIRTDLALDMQNTPVVRGSLSAENQQIDEGHFSGKKYGVKSGALTFRSDFNSSAVSAEDFVDKLNAHIVFDIKSPLVKGWNIQAIYDDLGKRDRTDGLANVVRDNLQNGETVFDSMSGTVDVVNADYVFKDTSFKAPDWLVSMRGSGSLDTWDMKAEFELTFPKLKINPLGFVMSGAMIAPGLTYDVSRITDVYDAHWAKVAADKKAAEQARLDYLNGLMQTQLEEIKKTQNDLLENVIPDLETKKKQAVHDNVKQKYGEIDAVVKETVRRIDELLALGLSTDFDEKLPQSMGEKNEVLREQIGQLKKDIATSYEKDVRQRINDDYNRIMDIYEKSKQRINEYREAFGAFPTRLAGIKTLFDINKDNTILEMRKRIDDNFLALDAVNTQLVKDYIIIQNSNDIVRLEEYTGIIKEMLEKSLREEAGMEENVSRLMEHAEMLTAKEEAAYAQKLKEEEIKKKLEENTGKISGAQGQSVTITRDIEEIEKMEAAKEREELPVLDFTGKAPKRGIVKKPEIIIEETEPAATEKDSGKAPEKQEESQSLLRKPTGEISKASGVIKKVE